MNRKKEVLRSLHPAGGLCDLGEVVKTLRLLSGFGWFRSKLGLFLNKTEMDV